MHESIPVALRSIFGRHGRQSTRGVSGESVCTAYTYGTRAGTWPKAAPAGVGGVKTRGSGTVHVGQVPPVSGCMQDGEAATRAERGGLSIMARLRSLVASIATGKKAARRGPKLRAAVRGDATPCVLRVCIRGTASAH